MNITFVNQKGGVGKTTVTLLAAAVLKKAGFDLAIQDTDPQGSAKLIAPNILDIPLLEDHQNAEYVLIDTPPRLDEKHMKNIFIKSDRIVLVTMKNPLDMLAAQPMAELIRKYKEKNSKPYVLFNNVEKNTVIGQQETLELAAMVKLKPLNCVIPHSTKYARLATDGISAVTGKLREAVLNVVLEILK